MGILRLLLTLLRPARRARRGETPSPRPPGASLAVVRGRCWVVDGDTIVIGGTRIRLAGIDAPELDQPYGQNAKRELMRLCQGQPVTAVPDGSASYDRVVATCRLDDGTDLSAEMVRAGLALDWSKHSGGRYRRLEAPGARRKLWRVDARQKGRMPPSPGRVQ